MPDETPGPLWGFPLVYNDDTAPPDTIRLGEPLRHVVIAEMLRREAEQAATLRPGWHNDEGHPETRHQGPHGEVLIGSVWRVRPGQPLRGPWVGWVTLYCGEQSRVALRTEHYHRPTEAEAQELIEELIREITTGLGWVRNEEA